jgi:hypothetical protein
MPHASARVLQLDLFLSDAQTYRDALARYETIRPVLRQERTLTQYSRMTGRRRTGRPRLRPPGEGTGEGVPLAITIVYSS